ncbi:TetR/AcrR family transcriptional regulator [Tissierella sp. MB52-C2]|uniref:TetR/AcrR family transcriptional regulator n=1 Tax=Tissierella sp. MB52-C2 TaxID=3070999 RepID=UPI00280A9325|nr:TetR/AcrR family transcriptional regulator [Tissierella sp. MB52-C2]WMM26155.1 TetR/AcrR family transcriptional regulator [Tissierella sp. MB52-C2]
MKSNTGKRMSREERREQILESALNIFIEKGYNGSTTMDIAKEAGISEVTLFRYFDSKKQIFLDAIEPILVTSLKESIVASKDLEPIEKLEYILKDRIKFISKHHEVIKLILMESQINPEIADFNFINQITSLLKDSIKETDMEIKDESFLIRLLMGSILSFLYLPKIDDGDIDNYVKNLIDKIIKQ